jgi:hypothetical protein
MRRSVRRTRRGAAALLLATRAAELALAAPFVVATRTARLVASGTSPTAADRAEQLRMVSEKVEAFTAGWTAMAMRMHRVQVEWALAALRAWLDAWRFPVSVRPPVSLAQSTAATRRLVRGWHDVANAGLAPVHRAATRNARRLSQRKR